MGVFSNNLRFLRESRGLKLDEFESLGIKKGTMSNYELGNTEPKLGLLCELSKFFGVSVDDLLNKDLSTAISLPNTAQIPEETITRIVPVSSADESIIYRMYKEKDLEVKDLMETIGSLKEQIRQLKRENERLVSGALGSEHANVG